ncbi:MAG TPA: biotin/lipoyl-containing protein [Solirubrobacterales bacterium]|nr:biotin/lipoyl-containing protein [Solirubrobacterales bacterium]
MEMTPETIKALLDAFDGSDWKEMIVTVGDDRLHVSRDPLPEGATLAPPPAASAPGPAAAPAGPVAAGDPPPPAVAKASSGVGPPTAPPAGRAGADIAEGHTAIEAPSVGLFWRSPSPGAPPFVEVGQQVKTGDTVAIVEVMKLMNHVAAPVDGVVSAILVENGGPVEFGQTIVTVDPEG